MNIALIGSGQMAQRHLKAFSKIGNLDVCLIFGGKNVSAVAKKFKIKKIAKDISELSARDFDFVDITSPTFTHAGYIKELIHKGFNVFCEKPVASNFEEMSTVLGDIKINAQKFMIGYQLRFDPQFQKVKKIVECGELGQIKNIWLRRGKEFPSGSWYINKTLSNGVVSELTTHAVDLFRWLLESEVESVYAKGQKIRNEEVVDNAWVTLNFKNGATGIIGSSYCFNFWGYDFGIVGEKYSIKIQNNRIFSDKASKSNLRLYLEEMAGGFHFPWKQFSDRAVREELNHFVECIEKDTSPIVGFQDGIENIKTVDAITRSIEKNIEVKIDDIPNNYVEGEEVHKY